NVANSWILDNGRARTIEYRSRQNRRIWTVNILTIRNMQIDTMMMLRSTCLTLLLTLAACAETESDITINNAWARATAPGQKVAAAYMDLASKKGAALVKAECNLAGSV